MELTLLDYIIFFLFVGGVALFGCSFFFKSREDASAFTAAKGQLPSWVVGMSIFATFVSSISFLGLPGGSYAGNWNQLVFSLSIPLATWLAAKVFLPLCWKRQKKYARPVAMTESTQWDRTTIWRLVFSI